MLLVHTVQGVDRRVEEGPGRGRIAVIGLVADPPGAWQREVGAHGRDAVGAASCVEKSAWCQVNFFLCPQIIYVQKSPSEQLGLGSTISPTTHYTQAFHLTTSMIKPFSNVLGFNKSHSCHRHDSPTNPSLTRYRVN